MRVLLVEDDAKIASFVDEGLRRAGFAVDTVSSGEEGVDLGAREPYDVMVIDVMLPGINGITMIERLRQRGVATPVLILSALQSVDDKIRGFKSGGDDYLTKPFSFSELLVRLEALIRRSSRNPAAVNIVVGDLTVDPLSRHVRRGATTIELQPKEYALLEYLARNSPQVVSKTMILEHVWNYHFDPQSSVIDVLIHRLRRKVDADFEPKLLQTVRGVGYALRVP
jgi:DNA-binding response OmpR family regulator